MATDVQKIKARSKLRAAFVRASALVERVEYALDSYREKLEDESCSVDWCDVGTLNAAAEELVLVAFTLGQIGEAEALDKFGVKL